MSTFFRQEEVFVTEEELEKTYNYIKNIMDSKISQLQKTIVEMQQKLQQREPIVQPDTKQQIEMKQQILNVNAELELKGQEISKINQKIELLEQDINENKNEKIESLDITAQLEQMTQQTLIKEEIESLNKQLEELREIINLQVKDILQIKEYVEENDENFSNIKKDIDIHTKKIQKIEESLNKDSEKTNVKSEEVNKKLQEQFDIKINNIETQIKEFVEEKLFEQNIEVQKTEQLLTLKMNKNSEETRNTREEIEKTKLKIEEIQLEWKNSENNKVTHYEIEQVNQKLLQIDNTVRNKLENQDVNELIDKKLKIKQEELESKFKKEIEQFKEQLEKENEAKIRKIIEDIYASQREEKSKEAEIPQISQILATIK